MITLTYLAKREFFDEYDNLSEINKVVVRKRYLKVFEFLFYQFNHEKKEWITSKILQERLGLIDHSSTHQILESFRILNMLRKNINKGKAYYYPINIEYWEEANKKISGGKDETINKN